MWTAENRGRYDRGRLRYPSDLTDEEWALIAPGIPPGKRGGNKRTVDLRGGQRADVYPEHGLPMAGDPERPAAALDLARLLRPVELGRHAGAHSSRALRRVPRTSRARGLAERRDHRQPEREKR
jgi:hypothetical protein